MYLLFSDTFNVFFLIIIDVCVCVLLNYFTCEKNGAIEMQHNNNSKERTV